MGQMYEIGRWRDLVPGNRVRFPLDLRTTALVCVDIQRKTCDRHSPRGMSKTVPAADPALAETYFSKIEQQVLPNVQKLLAFFRTRDARVVYFVVGPQLRDASDVPFSFRQNQARGLGAVITIDDPEGQICPEVAPRDGEPVFHKVGMGGFTGTGAENMLRSLGVDTLIFVGGHTQACVEATGRAAADLGFKVVVVEDAVINFLPLMHDAAMITFSGIGRVATTQELLDELDSAARAVPQSLKSASGRGE